MNLKEILAIAGSAGLYKYVAQGKGGIIVESLVDDRRSLVSGTSKVSALGDIAMFTDAAEVPLSEVLTTVYTHNKGAQVDITGKSTAEQLHDFMQSALPQYDRERVHNSDIKKLASWYNILVKAGFTTFTSEDEAAIAAADSSVDAADAPVKGATKAVKTAAKGANTAAKAAAKAPVKAAATPARAKVAAKSTTNRKSGV